MNAKPTSIICMLALSAGLGACRAPTAADAAGRGAVAILASLDARGEERLVAFEADIRGAAHPPCAVTEIFLAAQKRVRPERVRLVEASLRDIARAEPALFREDAAGAKDLALLAGRLKADTVVIAWAGEKPDGGGSSGGAGGQDEERGRWHATYLHMVAVDIPTGRVVASWSLYPGTARGVEEKIAPWFRQDDVVAVQPTLDGEVRSALLAGLFAGSKDRYSVVVRDLPRLLARDQAPAAAGVFSEESQERMRGIGATVIVGADSAMGQNLRAVDLASGAILSGLPGPLTEHIGLRYEGGWPATTAAD